MSRLQRTFTGAVVPQISNRQLAAQRTALKRQADKLRNKIADGENRLRVNKGPVETRKEQNAVIDDIKSLLDLSKKMVFTLDEVFGLRAKLSKLNRSELLKGKVENRQEIGRNIRERRPAPIPDASATRRMLYDIAKSFPGVSPRGDKLDNFNRKFSSNITEELLRRYLQDGVMYTPKELAALPPIFVAPAPTRAVAQANIWEAPEFQGALVDDRIKLHQAIIRSSPVGKDSTVKGRDGKTLYRTVSVPVKQDYRSAIDSLRRKMVEMLQSGQYKVSNRVFKYVSDPKTEDITPAISNNSNVKLTTKAIGANTINSISEIDNYLANEIERLFTDAEFRNDDVVNEGSDISLNSVVVGISSIELRLYPLNALARATALSESRAKRQAQFSLRLNESQRKLTAKVRGGIDISKDMASRLQNSGYTFTGETKYCFWRSLAMALEPKLKPDRSIISAKKLLKKYLVNMGYPVVTARDKRALTKAVTDYDGFDLANLDSVEDLFGVNINIMVPTEDESTDLSVKYECHQPDMEDRLTVNLLRVGSHVCFVRDFAAFTHQHQCDVCKGFFTRSNDLKRHVCRTTTTYKYPKTDRYLEVESPKLRRVNAIGREYGFAQIKPDEAPHPFVCYDFEAMLMKTGVAVVKAGEKRSEFISRHEAVSVSVKSSTPGKAVTVLRKVDESSMCFIGRFVQLVSEKVNELAARQRKIFEPIIKLLKEAEDPAGDAKIATILRYCNEIPVFGFNSAKYDVNLVVNELFSAFVSQGWELKKDSVIKKPSGYMVINFELPTGVKASFQDICNFLSPCSYDSFIASWAPGGPQKGVFPYEFLDSYEKLEMPLTQLKPQHFYSTLRKDNPVLDQDGIPNASWKRMQEEIATSGLKTLSDLLVFYNELDVVPFVTAVNKVWDSFTEFCGYDLTRDSVSISGIASKAMYSMALPTQKYAATLFNRKLNTTKGLCDGCLDPLCSVDITTCVRCEEANKMNPVGHKLEQQMKYACSLIPMLHRITETNAKCFDILANGVVGGPSIIFNRYQRVNKTMMTRPRWVAGKWVCETTKMCRGIAGFDANALYPWAYSQDIACGELTHDDLMETVGADPAKIASFISDLRSGKRYGFTEVTLKVPESKYDYFAEFPPIFKNSSECDDGVGRLISSMVQTEYKPVFTSLLLWYLDHGVEITSISGHINATRGSPFKDFVEKIANIRRDADKGVVARLYEAIAKLMSNSAFGQSCMDRGKFSTIRFMKAPELKEAFRNTLFVDTGAHLAPATKEDEDLFEVVFRKATVKRDMPIQLALCTFQLAKLRMLEFYYDCMDKYVDRSDFCYLEMDTDSAYMALSCPILMKTLHQADSPRKPQSAIEILSQIIKPGMEDSFKQEASKWFPVDAYSERTPGLFKLEAHGEAMVCLASKSYCLLGYGEDGLLKTKTACKGTQSRRNAENLTFDNYLKTLLTGENTMVENAGFRKVKVTDPGEAGGTTTTIQTYTQKKIGLNSTYKKRGLFEDSITTYPLSI